MLSFPWRDEFAFQLSSVKSLRCVTTAYSDQTDSVPGGFGFEDSYLKSPGEHDYEKWKEGLDRAGLAIDPFMSSGLFYPYQMDRSICQLRSVWFSLLFTRFLVEEKYQFCFTQIM